MAESLLQDSRDIRGPQDKPVGQDARDREESFTRAVKLLDAGKLDEAQVLLESLLEEDPSHSGALNKLGVIMAYKKQFDRAIDLFEAAIKANPDYPAPYSNCGNIYREKGNLERAIEYYQKAVSIDPEYAPAHHNLGVVYRQMGDYNSAIPLLKKAARLEQKRWKNATTRFQGKVFAYLLILLLGAFAVYLILRQPA